MKKCPARLADPNRRGVGVRVDIQCEATVSPVSSHTGHQAAVRFYWRLSCPHCMEFPAERHEVGIPVHITRLDQLIREYAEKHDRWYDYTPPE